MRRGGGTVRPGPGQRGGQVVAGEGEARALGGGKGGEAGHAVALQDRIRRAPGGVGGGEDRPGRGAGGP